MGQGNTEVLRLGIGGESYGVTEAMVDASRPSLPPVRSRLRAQPQDILIDLRKTAVIVVDMQNEFCSPGGWVDTLGVDLSGARALFAPINAVTTASRASGVPVIWLNWGLRPDCANISPGARYTFSDKKAFKGLGDTLVPGSETGVAPYPLLVKDSWGAAIVPELEISQDDIHVDKYRISGFWDTQLDSILRNLQVRTILFAGVNSDHCVLGTLMDANFHGYDTILIEDCTATTSPDFCHQAALHNIRFCFGFTTNSADLIDDLAGASE
jgi:nicotinamidase-related amidase